ncbi:MAG: hypothetical protein Fur0037_00090 [Planctomycetota bacterium]
MSSITPPSLEGTEGANQLEILWEKHKKTINLLLSALVVALGINYGYRYYRQKQIDRVWGGFAVTTGLATGYNNPRAEGQGGIFQAQALLAGDLAVQLADKDPAALEAGIASAPAAQRPFLRWAAAYSAYQHRDWDRAERLLSQLEKDYPEHVLVRETSYPVQFRESKKEEASDNKNDNRKKPDLEPAVAGSMVDRLRASIAEARAFHEPEQFAKPPIPEDAPRVEVKFKGGYGKFVIALLPDKAPKHVAKFLELVEKKHWDGVRVDEIHRPGKTLFQRHQPRAFHFGFLTSKDPDRTKWKDTKPSTEQVEYEANDLSHFPGAVAASMEAEKSSVDRIWINVDDDAGNDGEAVVFGYVVEGLESLGAICDLTIEREQERLAGRGTPTEDVEIESVTKL